MAGLCSCCGGSGSVLRPGDCPLCDGAGCFEDDSDDDAAIGEPLALRLIAEALCSGAGGASALESGALAVQDAPGGGSGLFARRRIDAGALLVAEPPSVTVRGSEALRKRLTEELGGGGAGTTEMRRVNEAFAGDDRLTRAVAEALGDAACEFLALSDSFAACVGGAASRGGGGAPRAGVWVRLPDDGALWHLRGCRGFVSQRSSEAAPGFCVVEVRGEEVLVETARMSEASAGTLGGIFLTNAVGDSARDVSHVYLLTSRINHSCRPNAAAFEHEGKRTVYATERIDVGEEICISYIEDYSAPRHAGLRARLRGVAGLVGADAGALLVALFRQQLFVKWGFWCRCARCAPRAAEADRALELWSGW